MDQDATVSSKPPAKGNWVTTACIAALVVLMAFVVIMMVIGSRYGTPEPEPPPGITIDTDVQPPPVTGAEPEADPAAVAEEEQEAAPEELPNPSAE